MAHGGQIVHCLGPDSPHALDNIPVQPRNGALDAKCPVCKGHGAWNSEIDLGSFRCKRHACDTCNGAGWIETGDDPVAVPDIICAPEGYPKWVTRYVDGAEVADEDGAQLSPPPKLTG